MKIATYNIWYPNIDIRAEQLIKTLNNIDADIVGLQEVPPSFYERLIANVNYPHHAYVLYDNEHGMGLAFLSKHALRDQFSLFESAALNNSIAHNSIFEVDGIRFSVTNVHLPWDSVLAKEQQVVAIDKYIHAQKDKAHFFILLGDFNCSLSSSAHHYLLGDQTLSGY
ncbi:MAG: endonuclease/exonuclease/phosphatase family protein, partial [Eubacteriales bacterium]|nr:endonuclease/exonuclease/phosphatase family protein [Eubacteriales bacterium]